MPLVTWPKRFQFPSHTKRFTESFIFLVEIAFCPEYTWKCESFIGTQIYRKRARKKWNSPIFHGASVNLTASQIKDREVNLLIICTFFIYITFLAGRLNMTGVVWDGKWPCYKSRRCLPESGKAIALRAACSGLQIKENKQTSLFGVINC